jgi:hypothetical protein
MFRSGHFALPMCAFCTADSFQTPIAPMCIFLYSRRRNFSTDVMISSFTAVGRLAAASQHDSRQA